MEQNYVNGLYAVSTFLMGWWSKLLWESIKEGKVADEKLLEKISSIQTLTQTEYATKAEVEKIESRLNLKLAQFERIEVHLASTYATRSDLNEMGKTIFSKLDQVLERLDKKVDKAGGS